jgi:hypothetical protein
MGAANLPGPLVVASKKAVVAGEREELHAGTEFPDSHIHDRVLPSAA